MEENVEKTIKEQQLDILKRKIPYEDIIFNNEDNYIKVLEDLLDDAKHIALSTIYPFKDTYNMELPKKYLNWQIRAAVELYNLGDKQGIISYSENGLAWTKDTDSLSKTLMNELTSKVGVPRKEDEQDE